MKSKKSPQPKPEAVFHLTPRDQDRDQGVYLQGDQFLRICGPGLADREPTPKEFEAAQRITDAEAWHLWLTYISGDDYHMLCGGDLYVGWLERVGELAGYGRMPDV